MVKMKIRITKGRWWYEDKVGEEFEALAESTYTDVYGDVSDESVPAYVVIDPDDGLPSFVLARDCVMVTETGADNQPDTINSPAHYTNAKFETIEIIEEITQGYEDGYVAYCVGNALKYLSRAPYKHEEPTEDLRKAGKYIAFAIEHLSKELTKEEE